MAQTAIKQLGTRIDDWTALRLTSIKYHLEGLRARTPFSRIMEGKLESKMTILADPLQAKPKRLNPEISNLSSRSHAQIDCQDDLLEKLRLKDFYKTQCLPYIGDNPSKQIELTYSSWVQELPGPHDISPDTYLQELVMGPEVDLTTDLFQLYKDHEYAKMLDLKRGPIPDFDTTGWIRTEPIKKAAPINYLDLPQPSLPASADAEASSPKSSSEREDGYIDVDDSYPNSDRRSKKKKKKRRHEREGEDGDDRKKKKKKRKKSKGDRLGSDEE